MYRSILVPLDGSPFAEHALPHALGIARRTGAEVRLVRVHVPISPLYTDVMVGYESTFNPELRKSEQDYLDSVANRLRRTAQVSVHPLLLGGIVADELAAAAKEADLVVMTTHGRGPLARFWLGSVADELVRRMPVPVLLVRPQEAGAEPAQEPVCQRVLIPLDGSPLAEQILKPAVDLGSSFQAEFTLLRVIAPMVQGLYGAPDDLIAKVDKRVLADLKAFHEADRAVAEAYLKRTAESLRTESLKVNTRVAVHELPAVAILDEIKAGRADVVALASHGRRGIPRLVLGSVADKVLRASPVPVLLHSPQHRGAKAA